MKVCTRCEQPKGLNEFYACKKSLSGKSPVCSSCKIADRQARCNENELRREEFDRDHPTRTCKTCKVEQKFHCFELSRMHSAGRHPVCGKCRYQKRKLNPKFNANIARAARKVRIVDPQKYLWKASKQRARMQGVPFTINPVDIFIPTHCPVLGIPLISSAGKWTDNSPSLDKLVPSRGYVPGNIEVISHRANALKRNATYEEIRRLEQWYGKKMREIA